MDIVYLIKTDPENDSEELRYSLRSLRNIPHNKVIIVGEKPDWVTNVEFIPVAQTRSKPENWGMNLSAAVRSALVSDDFVMMNDDFFIMKAIDNIPNLNFGDMLNLIKSYQKRYPEGSGYIDRMIKLHDLLVARGYEKPLSYELHVPMVLNKQRVIQMYQTTVGPIYQFRTSYGNYFQLGGSSVPDVKIFVDPSHNDPAYNNDAQHYVQRQVFLSTTGGAFKRGYPGEFIKSTLSEKSVYEL